MGEQHDFAIRLIGANIYAYGHFESYAIPDQSSKGVLHEEKYSQNEFLELVYSYYNSDVMNFDYFANTEDSKNHKQFIRNLANKYDTYKEGRAWIKSCRFKNN